MKKIYCILFLAITYYQCFSQSECSINRIEVYGYNYNYEFAMYPSIEDIKKGVGIFITSLDCDEIIDSKLYRKLQELEKREFEVPYIDDEGESEAFWTSKAIATVHFSDSTKEELFIMKRGIVWKNRRYENYYPLIESVYSFFPDRYFDKEYYRNKENEK